MTRRGRIGLLLASYPVCFILAFLPPIALSGYGDQESQGMRAFGDFLLFLASFGLLALIPTAIALWHLRSVPRFWHGVAVFALALAATAPVAAVVFPHSESAGAAAWLGFLALLRILGAPVPGLAWLIAALIAPAPGPRRILLISAAIEFSVSAYTVFSLAVLKRWPL